MRGQIQPKRYNNKKWLCMYTINANNKARPENESVRKCWIIIVGITLHTTEMRKYDEWNDSMEQSRGNVRVLYGSHYWPDWWLFVFERAYVSRISIPGGGGRMDGQHCGVIITTGRRWYCVRARGQWNDLGMMYRRSNNACSEPWPRSPIHPIECIIVLRSQWTTLCEAFQPVQNGWRRLLYW